MLANREIQRLQADYDQLGKQFSELVIMTAAVLLQKHDGKVDLNIAGVVAARGYQISRNNFPDFGIVRLEAVRNGIVKPNVIQPVSDQADPILLVWNTAGTVSLYNYQTERWGTVAGSVTGGIASAMKSATVGLDSSAQPYHFNVYAATSPV